MIENKQYILIRTDKKFPIGKIMSHVGHNVLLCNRKMPETPDYRNWYYYNDQVKITLDGGNIENIENIIRKAEQLNIATSFVEDIHIHEKIVAVIGLVSKKDAKYLGLDKLRLYNV